MMEELSEVIESIFDLRDGNKYNVSLGFFEKDVTAEADTSGKRFCDLKLHYKNNDSGDISAGSVPLLYIGSKNFIVDYRLEPGDELLVLFTDRTLEQWKDTSGTVPQRLRNPVKDSINHAVAIPIVSHHYANDIITSIDPTVGGKVAVKSGKKVQIGNDTTDLLDLVYQILEILLQQDSGGYDYTGKKSTKNNTLIQIKTLLQNITKFT